jgi:HD domain
VTLRPSTRALELMALLTAALVVAVAAVRAVPALGSVPGPAWLLFGVFVVTIGLGEIWRVSVLDSRDLAPLAIAASLAMALTFELPDQGGRVEHHGDLVLLAVGLASTAGGAVRRRLTGRPMNWDVVALRILVVGITVVLFRRLDVGGQPLVDWVTKSWGEQRWLVAVVLWLVAGVAMGLHVGVAAVQRAAQTHARLAPSFRDEASAIWPLALAVTSTAAVIPLAVGSLGAVAVPLFLVPLVLLRLAVARQSAVRTAQRQTIFALSRLTEQSGYTPSGHAARVARLAVAMGRSLGLAERELLDLEYAALLHDLGQVSLRRPIPGGATVQTSPLDQRRIATAGASILARTAELSRLSHLVADQSTPFRRATEIGLVPVGCRILKVANAYDDLLDRRHGRAAPVRALERIRLGTGYDYDPAVVQALCLVLQRDGQVTAAQVARLDV